MISWLEYIINLNIFGDALPTLALLLTSVLAYCTIVYHFSSSLSRDYSKLSGLGTAPIETLRDAKQTLRFGARLAIVPIIMILLREYLSCGQKREIVSLCGMLWYFINIIIPTSLVVLSVVGIAAENLVFELKYQETEFLGKSIDSVVYLKSGRKIRGWLLSAKFDDSKQYIDFVREDNTVTSIDIMDIAVIFLQKTQDQQRFLRPHKFKEGPKNLCLNFLQKEEFHGTRYYRKGDFDILKFAKRSSNSRFAIVNSQYVEDL